ncbi:MAG: cysteine methyltransferase [Alphaproteobacteria bacterium]|nr:cysteine methyltransferase [Alphaproteobacteria bacterium]|tara:strand:- start:5584 stop:6069 length:486 start_codon:yes stop_codon:yes gene_type:complete
MNHALEIITILGPIVIKSDGYAITSLNFGQIRSKTPQKTLPVLNEASKQLYSYFKNISFKFTVPINPSGTDFQLNVWNYLSNIPYGETKTYGAIANILNTSPRAIGAACSRNPILIVIPCHRVLGSNGNLGGFSGGSGINTKICLLKHENANQNLYLKQKS